MPVIREGKEMVCQKPCCGNSTSRCVGQLILSIVVLVGVFVIGVSLGARLMAQHTLSATNPLGQTWGRGMMPPRLGGEGMFARSPQANDDPSFGMMDRATNATGTHFFGSISKIDGANITFIDNAAKAETVTSQATTQIQSNLGRLSLTSLKVGQTIDGIATPSTDASSTSMLAQVIHVE